MDTGAFVGIAALVAAVLLMRRSSEDEYPDEEYSNATEYEVIMPSPSFDRATNLSAFLWAVGAAETTPAQMMDGSAFRRFYGVSNWFTGFDDHPVLTGEKKGVPLPPDMCRRAGIASGNCTSTAAGAWQMNIPTWTQVREPGAWGPRLPDFSPESQAEGARRVLMLAGALDAAEAGAWEMATALVGARWASLPEARGGQRQKTLAEFMALIEQGLRIQTGA